MTGDTIAALSSGSLPAGIAVIRTSGPAAGEAARRIAGALPEPRRAVLRRFVDPADGSLIDRGMLLWLPGPRTATGEDIVEYHCHGGRATVLAMLGVLGAHPGVRPAEPGEFSRRALAKGIIDLTAAEGLADLLEAETELQRKVALRRSEGAVRRTLDDIRDELLSLSAAAEMAIDYDDEGESATATLDSDQIRAVADCMRKLLDQPPVERLRSGLRVVVAGPPNAGKSSLVNYLSGVDRAIVTDVAGTTRDTIEVPLSFAGVPFVLVDTAGLREAEDDVEAIGVERANREVSSADIVLWLGDAQEAPPGSILVAAKSDLREKKPGLAVSSKSEEGREALFERLAEEAKGMLPSAIGTPLTTREARLLRRGLLALQHAEDEAFQPEIRADHLRQAREAIDEITGTAGIENMLDALFGRFCVGK